MFAVLRYSEAVVAVLFGRMMATAELICGRVGDRRPRYPAPNRCHSFGANTDEPADDVPFGAICRARWFAALPICPQTDMGYSHEPSNPPAHVRRPNGVSSRGASKLTLLVFTCPSKKPRRAMWNACRGCVVCERLSRSGFSCWLSHNAAFAVPRGGYTFISTFRLRYLPHYTEHRKDFMRWNGSCGRRRLHDSKTSESSDETD